MNMLAKAHAFVDDTNALLARVASLVPRFQANASTLDRESAFPSQDIAALGDAGGLGAVLPRRFGGLGIGTEPGQALATAAMLHDIGAGSIALGRIFEAHLNAIRLVMRYGNPAQRDAASVDSRAGHLHALWVTDGAAPLTYAETAEGVVLDGAKLPCSAAGHATRAVVTASSPQGETRLLLLPLQHGEVVTKLPGATQGVRAAANGRVAFSGVNHARSAVFGNQDDYLREPDFSAGAWRASAVTVGGLSALVEAVRAELQQRGRLNHPQQRERLGRMFIHAQTARLWLRHVAAAGEGAEGDEASQIATVNLARIAIETACLDTIQLVQRSLGLSAFLQSNVVERMCRDLATYLRQPAPDEALDDAAGYFAADGAFPSHL